MASELPAEKKQLFEKLIKKAELKQTVYHQTFKSFKQLKKGIDKLNLQYQQYYDDHKPKYYVEFDARLRGDYEIELKFGGDILLFLMHTNVFEFSRSHSVMKTQYVKEDTDRSFCGMICIYNFLGDSFKYNRVNDVGYMIGRIFINNDNHYFIEGKKELGYLFNNFGDYIFDNQAIENVVEAAIKYTVNFDLLTPPYQQMQEVSINEMKSTLDAISLKTGKRLGFKFQADTQNEK